MPKYLVHMSRATWCTVSVEADTEIDAVAQAEKKAKRNDDLWDCDVINVDELEEIN